MQQLANPRTFDLAGFGGASALLGNRLVRLTYLDEGGTSLREPKVVVAGVLVDGDHQLVHVERHLKALAAKHIPEPVRDGFIFHATDIWSGGKLFKDKNEWPWERRAPILSDLADIPHKFDLPITHGLVTKERIKAQLPDPTPQKFLDLLYHACAFANATQVAERFFRDYAPDEYSIVIAEDRDKVRQFIKKVQSLLQGNSEPIAEDILNDFAELPYQHIRDTVHWASKRDSPVLQVADTCAFFVRGAAVGHKRAQPFFAQLSRTLLPPPGVRLGVLPSGPTS